MIKKIHLITLIMFLSITFVKAQQIKVRIIAPTDNSTVTWKQSVTGNVSTNNSNIWLIIHPMSISTYYVQPAISIHEDGTWKVYAYFGENGKNKDEHFEICAFVNPKERLKEGKELKAWPVAAAKSNIIEVIRK